MGFPEGEIMATSEIRFNPAKALEAIVLIARRQRAANLESDVHAISKLLYWADQWHLENYGSTVCGDHYIAMKFGPVPSNIYDMIKFVRGDGKFNFPKEVLNGFVVENKYQIRALRQPNLNKLSAAEQQAINRAIDLYGGMSFAERTQESHDAAWQSADPNGEIQMKKIIELLPNANHVLEYIDAE